MVALLLLGLSGSLWWTLRMLHEARGNLIPFVTGGVQASFGESAALAVVAGIAAGVALVGVAVGSAALIGGTIPRQPSFPLPPHLQTPAPMQWMEERWRDQAEAG